MIYFDVEQNTDYWHALRCGKATASSFGVIMANEGKAFGEPAKRYALQIALERINGFKSDSGYSNSHMERGHEQEPIARALYEQEYFYQVKNGGFFCCGDYGDSPDGLIDNDGVLEIKSVISSTHYATMRRGNYDPSYTWQLIGHLDCTGRSWVDFVSYCSEFPEDKQLIVHRLNREENQDKINRLRSRREEFLSLVDEIYNSIAEYK